MSYALAVDSRPESTIVSNLKRSVALGLRMRKTRLFQALVVGLIAIVPLASQSTQFGSMAPATPGFCDILPTDPTLWCELISS